MGVLVVLVLVVHVLVVLVVINVVVVALLVVTGHILLKLCSLNVNLRPLRATVEFVWLCWVGWVVG